MKLISVCVQNYKGFSDSGTIFKDIKRVNILSGENNAGKSAFLEILYIFSQALKKPDIRSRLSMFAKIDYPDKTLLKQKIWNESEYSYNELSYFQTQNPISLILTYSLEENRNTLDEIIKESQSIGGMYGATSKAFHEDLACDLVTVAFSIDKDWKISVDSIKIGDVPWIYHTNDNLYQLNILTFYEQKARKSEIRIGNPQYYFGVPSPVGFSFGIKQGIFNNEIKQLLDKIYEDFSVEYVPSMNNISINNPVTKGFVPGDFRSLKTNIYRLHHSDSIEGQQNYDNFVKKVKKTIGLELARPVLKDNTVDVCFKTPEGLISIDHQGKGILQALHLVFSLEINKSKYLLVDEPERSLFNKLQRQLRNILLELSKEYTIFIATHSNEFYGRIDETSYHKAISDNSSIKMVDVENVDLENVRYRSIMIDLLLNDKLIFVEGSPDFALLQEAIPDTYPYLSVMLGKKECAKSLVEVCNKFQVTPVFVYDLDQVCDSGEIFWKCFFDFLKENCVDADLKRKLSSWTYTKMRENKNILIEYWDNNWEQHYSSFIEEASKACPIEDNIIICPWTDVERNIQRIKEIANKYSNFINNDLSKRIQEQLKIDLKSDNE